MKNVTSDTKCLFHRADFHRLVIMTALLLLCGLSVAMAQEDFGDAPDGTPTEYPFQPAIDGLFPTTEFSTNVRIPGFQGIQHDVTDQIWLGGPSSVTTLEITPNLTDLDDDDSGAFWWISLTGIPALAVLDLPITIAPGAPDGPYYLNVLVDQNNDGEWKNLTTMREWVVIDRPIVQSAGTTERHSVKLPWSNGLLITPKWARITVSAEPIAAAGPWGSDGWDGSMPPGLPLTFGVGETEDRFVGATYPGTAGPGGGSPGGPAGGGNGGGMGGGGGPNNGGPNPPGKCLMKVNCQPKNLTVRCGESGTISCEVKYLSGVCPNLPQRPGAAACNAMVAPRFLRHLRGAGPKAIVSPASQCTTLGPGARKQTFVFSVTFGPPCNQPIKRKQRWTFDLTYDPEGLYSLAGPDEQEGIILSETSPTCGNFIPEPGESCDDGNLVSGDGCGSDCNVEIYIPNGILEPGEECDDANMIPGDGCDAFGTREYCGNFRLDPHEACDDGNNTNGDGCNEICQPESPGSCGNGVVDNVYETCDDSNLVDGDGCNENCQTEECGNGVRDVGEQCDDLNTTGGDGCSALCQSENVCGNGWVDTAESCDDGNLFNDDGCDDSCEIAPVYVRGLRFLEDDTTLVWESVIEPLRAYDLLRGNLSELNTSGGDYNQPGSTCLGVAISTERAENTATPASGQGFYYLVRVNPDRFVEPTYAPEPPADGLVTDRNTAASCD